MSKLLRKVKAFPVFLCGIFAVALILRFYRLGEIPDILHVDEVGIGYNAWCLANYGVDRYLNPWPIYPQNYVYSGQSPLYTYCLVLLLKWFPLSSLTTLWVRLPALFFSMLTVVSTAWILHLLFENSRVTLAGTAFVTVCPYFIMSGRIGLDCNLMLGTSALALALLIRYLKKPTWPALFSCGAGFSLILYSYALSYLTVPIFLATFSLYLLYTRKISFGRLVVMAIEICLLALPLILFVICILFQLPGFRFLGIYILPIAAGRAEELGQMNFWDNVWAGIRITLTRGIFPFDAVEKFYTLYAISIPFLVIGFFTCAKVFVQSLFTRCFAKSAVFLFYAAAVLFTYGVACTFPYRIYQANAIFVCYAVFWVMGLRAALHFFHRYQKVVRLTICVSYAIWLAAFIRYYFAVYSIADMCQYPNSLYFFISDKKALDYAVNTQGAEKVYLDVFLDEYYYFYNPISPYERSKNLIIRDTGQALCATVNYYTPIEAASAYMVHKDNQEFLTKLYHGQIPYEMTEFEHYDVFFVRETAKTGE